MKEGTYIRLRSFSNIIGVVKERMPGVPDMYQISWLNHPNRTVSWEPLDHIQMLSREDVPVQYQTSLPQ